MRSLFVVFLLLAGSAAWCKCSLIAYSVSGRVLDATGRPVSGVELAVEWSQLGKIERVATSTSSDGTYNLTIPFYPSTGVYLKDRGDICTAVLSEFHATAIRGAVKKDRTVQIAGEVTSVDWVFD